MSLDDENVKCCDDCVVKPVINVPVSDMHVYKSGDVLTINIECLHGIVKCLVMFLCLLVILVISRDPCMLQGVHLFKIMTLSMRYVYLVILCDLVTTLPITQCFLWI